MKELDLQDKYLIHFLCKRSDGLNYNEAKANTVSSNYFVLEDLKQFLSETELNKSNYRKLLRKFDSEKSLLNTFTTFLDERINSSMNMAVFINSNQSVTFEGVKLHLFYPSGTETHGDELFNQNIFTVVQEYPVKLKYQEKLFFSFRPDITFFINGIYLGYNELKSNYNNQNANRHGRKKVSTDYLNAVNDYLLIAKHNDQNQSIRKNFLKFFEKAIHITATDIEETYIIRNISNQFDEIKNIANSGYNNDDYEKKLFKDFKSYPLTQVYETKTERFEEVFRAIYDKKMIEKEILYYNFIERELIKKEGSKTKDYKHNDGRLISPRPKQKFGTDKIINKIDEFLENENDPNYFLNKLDQNLRERGLGEEQIKELVNNRNKYQNNKTVYSLLLQYAAGFGKSNIIGWTALQLKDLRRNDEYVYDKIMLVVDRLQLRDQLDSKMQNMNIQKGMFIEASDRRSFLEALKSERRILIVNIQKFSSINDILDPTITEKLSKLRIAFLIDEIHRSQSGVQHEEMISVFDELQSSFDNSQNYQDKATKKNLIVGFTATPSEHTLARFGEFNKYAEAEKIWIPFDSYTMKEAIKDGYILNPIKGIVPVSAKMFFDIPDSELEGFEDDFGYEEIPNNTDTGIDAEGNKYAIRKKKIYENPERVEAISKFLAQRLVSAVYPNIRGTAKAMLACASISSAIMYKKHIKKYFDKLVVDKRYERFKDAPIYIVYSDSQDYQSSTSLNDGLSESTVLQNYMLSKNGLIIVVDKLQTGFDEPKLHSLFLDKEINGINAIQTISRVNRTTKHKNDCKIIDFSYKNVNVKNIRKAFEHFSNVVVSNFDPLGDEEKLGIYYEDLKSHTIYSQNFTNFKSYKSDGSSYNKIDKVVSEFERYIKTNPEEAKYLKKRINKYFRILNLIEFVIQINPKYSNEVFLEFWKRYSIIYNQINKFKDIIDDVGIYFDNRIGIVAPDDYVTKSVKATSRETDGEYDTKFKYNILKVIEKRNEEEEAIAELIQDFEDKIDAFFNSIKADTNGQRLIAKINDDGSAFTQDEIFNDFERIYKKYIIINKNLGEFFKKETKDILHLLYEDFERLVKTNYNYV